MQSYELGSALQHANAAAPPWAALVASMNSQFAVVIAQLARLSNLPSMVAQTNAQLADMRVEIARTKKRTGSEAGACIDAIATPK